MVNLPPHIFLLSFVWHIHSDLIDGAESDVVLRRSKRDTPAPDPLNGPFPTVYYLCGTYPNIYYARTRNPKQQDRPKFCIIFSLPAMYQRWRRFDDPVQQSLAMRSLQPGRECCIMRTREVLFRPVARAQQSVYALWCVWKFGIVWRCCTLRSE